MAGDLLLGWRGEDLEELARRFPGRAAQSLRSMSALVRELLDCVECIVIIVDPSRRILVANRRASLFFGRTPAELSGRRLESLVAPHERCRVEPFVRGAEGSRASGEVRALTGEGEEVRLAFTLCPLAEPESEASGYLLVSRGEPRSRLRVDGDPRGLVARLMRGFADPLLVVEAGGRTVIDCNAAYLAALGAEREEVLGRLAFERALDREAVTGRADRAYAEAGVFQERIVLRRKDGSWLHCDCTALPILRSDGSPELFVVMLFDRSREARREEELSSLASRARELSERLASLASSRPAPGDSARTLSGLGFTRRQVEIAQLLAAGASSKEIGHQLGIAESTVKNHLAVMFRKLGARSRLSFMRAVVDRDLKLA